MGQVDFERKLLLLPESKTGEKTVVLSEQAFALLTAAKPSGSVSMMGGKPTGEGGNPYVIAARRRTPRESTSRQQPHKAWVKVRTPPNCRTFVCTT